MIKVIGTAYKRDDFTTQEFFDYWRDVHAPISAKIGPMRGYVVSEVIRKVQGELHAEAFIEQWWDDLDAFEKAGETPEMEVAWADVSNYAKTTGTFWVTKEHVYIPPPIPTRRHFEQAGLARLGVIPTWRTPERPRPSSTREPNPGASR